MPKRNEAETEITQEYIQELIDDIKAECDLICEEYPDNFLFVTKYGGEVTAKKILKDPATDIDLRLVCINIPDDDTFQDKIRERIKHVAGNIPTELYFHSLDKYLSGEIGETGQFDSLEVISNNLSAKEINTKISSSLLSLYTFATMEFFSTKTNSEILKRIALVAERSQSESALKITDIDQVNPQKILESIQVSREDIVEWIHVFFKFFFDDYKKQQKSELEGAANKNEQIEYLQRLAKYLIRIGFGAAIKDCDPEILKNEYVEQLKADIHSDQVHFNLIKKYNPNWLKIEKVKTIMGLATHMRTGVADVIVDEETDQAADIAVDEETAQALDELQTFIENLINLISQQVGITHRKKKSQNSFQDRLSEIASLNLPKLEHSNQEIRHTFYVGEHLITYGEKSDVIWYIPKLKSDGTQNGTYAIHDKNGEIIKDSFRDKEFVGEYGVFTKLPRTTTLIANGPIEAIEISGQTVVELLGSKKDMLGKTNELVSLFHHVFGQGDVDKTKDLGLEEINKASLTFSFLKHFSLEFIKYLNERVNMGSTFFSANIEQNNSEQEKNVLSQYTMPFFSQVVEQLALKEKIQSEVIFATDQDIRIDLNDPSNRNSFFVILDCENRNGVAVQFNKVQTKLLKSDFFGETALLQEDERVNYSILVPPGTRLLKIDANSFLEHTVNVDMETVKITKDDGSIEEINVVLSELLFHIGAVNLRRLQLTHLVA